MKSRKVLTKTEYQLEFTPIYFLFMSNNSPSENPYEGPVTEEKLESIRGEISGRRLFVYFTIVGLIGLGAVRTVQLLTSDNQEKYTPGFFYPAPLEKVPTPSVQPSSSAGNGMADANSVTLEGGVLGQPDFKDVNQCANLDWDSCSIKNGLPADVRESLTKLENEFIQTVKPNTPKKDFQNIIQERNRLIQPHQVSAVWSVKIIDNQIRHYIRYRRAR